MARGAAVLMVLGISIAANGCGGSSSGGKGGAGGGSAGATGGAGVGGQSGGTGGTAGGGTAGTGGAPACGDVTNVPGSGETCNAVTAGGPCVLPTFSTAATPAPAGGAFASGTYNLISETFYGPAAVEPDFTPGQPYLRTFVLSNVTATSYTVDQVWASGTYMARSHETAAVSGMTTTLTQTCPPSDAGANWAGSWDFTATSSSITLFHPLDGVAGVTIVDVYNKAP